MTLAAALRYLRENVAAIRIDFIVLSHRLCPWDRPLQVGVGPNGLRKPEGERRAHGVALRCAPHHSGWLQFANAIRALASHHCSQPAPAVSNDS